MQFSRKKCKISKDSTRDGCIHSFVNGKELRAVICLCDLALLLKKQTFSDMVETNDKLASIGDKKVDEQFQEPILNTGFYCQFLAQTPPP